MESVHALCREAGAAVSRYDEVALASVLATALARDSTPVRALHDSLPPPPLSATVTAPEAPASLLALVRRGFAETYRPGPPPGGMVAPRRDDEAVVNSWSELLAHVLCSGFSAARAAALHPDYAGLCAGAYSTLEAATEVAAASGRAGPQQPGGLPPAPFHRAVATAEFNFFQALTAAVAHLSASLRAWNGVYSSASRWMTGGLAVLVRRGRALAAEASWAGKPFGEAATAALHERVFVDQLRNIFTTIQLKGRSAPEPATTSQWAVLLISNTIIDVAVRRSNLRLAFQTASAVTTCLTRGLKLEDFPAPQRVTYWYHYGRLCLLYERPEAALAALEAAARDCAASAHGNRRRILEALLLARLSRGIFPRPGLLQEAGLPHYEALVAALRGGQLGAFLAELARHRLTFMRSGYYMQIERLQVQVVRALLRRTAAAYARLPDAPVNTNQIPLRHIVAAFKASVEAGWDASAVGPGEDEDDLVALVAACRAGVDPSAEADLEDEVRCWLVNLIASGAVKGYLSHRPPVLVLSKTGAFSTSFWVARATVGCGAYLMQSGLRTRHHESATADGHSPTHAGPPPLHAGSELPDTDSDGDYGRSRASSIDDEARIHERPPLTQRWAAWLQRLEEVAGAPVWSLQGSKRLAQAATAAARRQAAAGWDSGAAPFGLVMAASAAMNTLFVTYYLDLFLNMVRVTPSGFYAGQLVFMAWNAINDPVLGWLSDRFVGSKAPNAGHSGAERQGSSVGGGQAVLVLPPAAHEGGSGAAPAMAAAEQAQTHLSRLYRRVAAIRIGGAAWAVAFALLWWPWVFLPGPDSGAVAGWAASFVAGLHFTLALCAYDGCLTYVEVNHSALLSELSSDVGVRARATAWAAVCAAVGSLTSFLGYLMWPRTQSGMGLEEAASPAASLRAFRGMTLVIALAAILAFEAAGRGITGAAVRDVHSRGMTVVFMQEQADDSCGEGSSDPAPAAEAVAVPVRAGGRASATPPSSPRHTETGTATAGGASAAIVWPGVQATAAAVLAWASAQAQAAWKQVAGTGVGSPRRTPAPASSSPRFDASALFSYWRFLGRLARQRNFIIFVALSTLQSFDCTFQKNSFAPFMDTLTGGGSSSSGIAAAASGRRVAGLPAAPRAAAPAPPPPALDTGGSEYSGGMLDSGHTHHRPADDQRWRLPGEGPGGRKLLAVAHPGGSRRGSKKGDSLLGHLLQQGLGQAAGGGADTEDFDSVVRAAAAAAGVGDTVRQQEQLFKGRPAPKPLAGWGAPQARHGQLWQPEPPVVPLEDGQELPPAARAGGDGPSDALLGLRRVVDFEDDPGLDARDADDDDTNGSHGGGKAKAKAGGHHHQGEGGHGHGHQGLLDKLLRDGGRSLEEAEAATVHGGQRKPVFTGAQQAPQQKGTAAAAAGRRAAQAVASRAADTPLSATARGAIISLSFFAPHCLTVLWAPLVRAQGVATTLSQVFTLRLVILMAGVVIGRLSSSLGIALYMLLNRTTSESVCRLFPLVVSDVVDEHGYIGAAERSKGRRRRRVGTLGSRSPSASAVTVAIDAGAGSSSSEGPQSTDAPEPREASRDELDVEPLGADAEEDEATYLIDYARVRASVAGVLPAPVVAAASACARVLKRVASPLLSAPAPSTPSAPLMPVASASIVGSATCVAKLSQSLAPMLTYSLLAGSHNEAAAAPAATTPLPDRIWSLLVWVSLLIVMVQSSLWVSGFTLQGAHLAAVKAWAKRTQGGNRSAGEQDGSDEEGRTAP